MGVIDIVNNDSLSPAQKVLQIFSSLMVTLIAVKAATFLGAFFMNPAGIVVGAALAIMVGVCLPCFWLL